MDPDEIKREALSDSSKSLVKLGEMVAENTSLFQPVVEIVRVGLSILEKPYETYNPSDPNRHRKTLEIAANLFTGLNSALAPRIFRSSPGDIASLQTVAGPIYEWALVFYQTHFLDIAEVTRDKSLLVDVCLQLAKLFQSFSLVQELANIMATTPGFITRVTMLWIHSIWNVLDMRLYYQPTVISLSSQRQVIQRCLDCSIPGDIIAKCCSIMLTQKSTSSPSGTYPMDGPIGFVVAISGFSEKFRHALVAKHAPSWLCRQLSIHISKEKDGIIEDPLRTVEVILTGVWRFGLEGPRCIVDMLDSNIVALLSNCASLPGSRCTKESVRLLELIAKFLFYRPIIPRVAKCLRALDIESLTPGPIRDALLSLKEVTLLRERVLENYVQSREYCRCSLFKCKINNDFDDEDPANKDRPRLVLRHCAKCHSVSYCSAECQKIDWKNSHKLMCKMISHRVLDGLPPDLTERDRHFILYIVEQDVRDNEEIIEKLKAEHQGPGVPFVEINYDAVPRTIVIKTSEEFRGRELPEDHMEHVEDAKCGKMVIGFRVSHTTEEVFDAVVTYPFDWRIIF